MSQLITSPVTRVVVRGNVRTLVKPKKLLPSSNEIRRIEAEMRAIFFFSKCNEEQMRLYNHLETKWKELKNYRIK